MNPVKMNEQRNLTQRIHPFPPNTGTNINTHTHTHTPLNLRTHTHTLSFPFSLSLSHTYTHTHTRPHTHTHAHTHTHTHTHTNKHANTHTRAKHTLKQLINVRCVSNSAFHINPCTVVVRCWLLCWIFILLNCHSGNESFHYPHPLFSLGTTNK